jgi:hypothetical protein
MFGNESDGEIIDATKSKTFVPTGKVEESKAASKRRPPVAKKRYVSEAESSAAAADDALAKVKVA